MRAATCASPSSDRAPTAPPTGGAVVFSCSLLHEATPVTSGKRYAFLPFLYDEEGARIGQKNDPSWPRAAANIGSPRARTEARPRPSERD